MDEAASAAAGIDRVPKREKKALTTVGTDERLELAGSGCNITWLGDWSCLSRIPPNGGSQKHERPKSGNSPEKYVLDGCTLLGCAFVRVCLEWCAPMSVFFAVAGHEYMWSRMTLDFEPPLHSCRVVLLSVRSVCGGGHLIAFLCMDTSVFVHKCVICG